MHEHRRIVVVLIFYSPTLGEIEMFGGEPTSLGERYEAHSGAPAENGFC